MELMVILLYFLVAGCNARKTSLNVYNKRLMKDAGLVWMENKEGAVHFKHVYLGGSTMWRNKPPQPFTVAKTKKGRHKFTHMDVDFGNRTLVMADAGTKSIIALTFDEFTQGTNEQWTLYRGTSSQVNGIAIDWITDVVYWTDAVYDVIYAASMLYNHAAKVIVDDVENPHGIATYPQKGFLFWSEVSSKRRPRIVRSTLGGRHHKVIAYFFDRKAYALHIDYAQERLYWVYSRGDETGIEYSTLSGTQSKIIKNAKLLDYFIFDIDLYNNQLMYVERHGGKSYLGVSDKENSSIYKMALQSPATGLRVLDPDRQYQITNMCELSSCPGVCTKSNETEDCACLDELKDTVDESVARMYCGAERFSGILVNKGGGIFAMPTNFAELSASNSSTSVALVVEPRMVVPSRSIIKAMTSDIGTNKIYFYEYQNRIIKSVRMESNAEPEIMSMAVEDVGGLAFDPLGDNLYWTDVIRGHIMVTNQYGEFPLVLHENLKSPHAIAVHPGKYYRYLFWSEKDMWGSVWRSYLDGTARENILPNLRLRHVKALTVDIETNKLYILCARSIYVSELNGNNSREILYREPDQSRESLYRRPDTFNMLTGITVVHDYLVVSDTDWRSSGLHAFNKTTAEGEKLTFIGKATFPFFYHGNWHGVTYHHRSNQPRGSLCELRSTKCEQLCLPGRPRTVRCACTLGYIADGATCKLFVPYRPFILVADQRYRKLVQIRHTPRSYLGIPVRGIKQPFAIAYDPVRKFKSATDEKLGQVYWSDLETGSISRSYMDGSYQEVIVHDAAAYITAIELDPNSRLLFYLSRPRRQHWYMSSLVVLNIDSGLTKMIIDGALDDPISIAVSERHGYVYLVEQNAIWRATMDGSNLEPLITDVHSTAIAVHDNHLYFTNVSEGRRVYEPIWTHLMKSDVNGVNVTFLVNLGGTAAVSDLAIDSLFIYWTNTRSRGLQFVNLTGPYNVDKIMSVDKLFKPTGMSVHLSVYTESPCSEISCSGLCLGTGDGNVMCDYNVTESKIETDDTALCRIPVITNGEVVDNEVDRVVPDGYSARVRCYAKHRISNDFPITCVNGSWSHIPHCILEYDICGTIYQGYKVYLESGHYFVYPEMTKVHAILIGGGGGGYDSWSEEMERSGKAGDGGNSSFGDLVVNGGEAGTPFRGGKGGKGFMPGGDGQGPGNCTTGGTAGQHLPSKAPGRPGTSVDLFAGAGGYSDECTVAHIRAAPIVYSGPGGSEKGYYGGGAGARQGGAGGGGGWSRKTFTELLPRQLVPVHVGQAGSPSYVGKPGSPTYNPPGPGLVVVTWGDFPLDEYVRNGSDVVNTCVLD